MLLDQLGPPGFRFNDFEAPRYPFITLYARADGQAVVCPLLRGSSPTRGVAPKQHRGLGRAFTPAFRAGSLSLRICRGEIWFRPARCCSTSSGRPDLDLMISRPRATPSSPSTRALMARPWSARCYGVARPREGSRQNSIGGSGVLSLRHFGLVLYPLESAATKYGFGRRDAARPVRAARI